MAGALQQPRRPALLSRPPTRGGRVGGEFRHPHLPQRQLFRNDGRMLVGSLGHLALDVIMLPRERLAVGDDTTASSRVGAGGQAANVAAWAADLGAASRFVGTLGDDAVGCLVRDELTAFGVEIVGPTRGRSGVVVSLVGEDGERTMASDRASCSSFSPPELQPDWIEGCDWLHVSGYALVEEPLASTAVKASAVARAAGAGVSVDLSSAALIREFGVERFRARLAELFAIVVFANELEHEALDAGRLAETVVVKRGSRGCVVFANGVSEDFAALPTDTLDTTGAGDAFAAGFIVGGPALALKTAARCVAKIGGMP